MSKKVYICGLQGALGGECKRLFITILISLWLFFGYRKKTIYDMKRLVLIFAMAFTMPFLATGQTCLPLTEADLPYFEDFESYANGTSATIGECWAKGTNYRYYPYPTSSSAINGTRHLYFYSTTAYYSWASLPGVAANIDMSGLELRFKAKRHTYTGTTYKSILYVGITTTTAGFASAAAIESATTWVDTVDLTSSASGTVIDVTVRFAGYTGSGREVVLYAPTTVSGTNYIYVDDVVLRPSTSCAEPTAVEVTSVGTTTATIAWTPDVSNPSPAGGWIVEYGPEGHARGTGATVLVQSGTSCTLTGLADGTGYDVYVCANCGADGLSIYMPLQPLRFHTARDCGRWASARLDTIGTGSTANTYGAFYASGTNYAAAFSSDIYLASELQALGIDEGGRLHAVWLHGGTSGGTIHDARIYVAHTDLYAFGSTVANDTMDRQAMQLVYSGDLTVGAGQWVEIPFSQPFEWSGDSNLMITFARQAAPSGTVNFYSTAASNGLYRTAFGYRTAQAHNFTTSRSTTRPDLVFDICATYIPCRPVEGLAVLSVGDTDATLGWTAPSAGGASGYQVVLSGTELDEDALDARAATWQGTATGCTLTGLAPYTQYYAYVRSNCTATGSGYSPWTMVPLHTEAVCGVVGNIEAAITSRTTATLQWTKTKPQQTSNFSYILSTTGGLGDSQLDAMSKTGSGLGTTSVGLTGLQQGTTYHIYVQNNCGGGSTSPWIEGSFRTYDPMPAVVNIAAETLLHTSMVVTWERNEAQFADETAWQTAIRPSGSSDALQWSAAVGETRYTFIGLTAETDYDVYVRPCNAATGVYGTETYATITTQPMPTVCLTVADGTTANQYVPLYGYYTDAVQTSQSLYPASMLTEMVGQTVSSIKYFVASGSSANWAGSEWTVKMGVSSRSNLQSGLDNTASLTTVYTGRLTASVDDGMTVVLDTPFEYTGGNLLIQFDLPTASTGYTACTFYGISSTNASYLSCSSGAGVKSFLPKVEICRTRSGCSEVNNLAVTGITSHGAHVGWLPGNAETSWQYAVGAEPLDDSTKAARAVTVSGVTELNLTGLDNDIEHHFYIRPVCGAEQYGEWAETTFTTLTDCGCPTASGATNIGWQRVTLNATPHATIGTPAAYTFRYWASGDEEHKTILAPSQSGSIVVSGLQPSTAYYYQVRTTCTGTDGDSRWSDPAGFTTSYRNFAVPYSTDFASAGRDGEWQLLNGTVTNKWYVGETDSSGRCLFISNDGGMTNTYTNNSSSVVFAFVGLDSLVAGSQYTVDFDWRAYGESTYDYLRVWLVPDDLAFSAGTALPTGVRINASPSGWLPLDGNYKLNLSSQWQHHQGYAMVEADGNYKLVFMWRNDGNIGSNPPVAIDNVSIAESPRYSVAVSVRPSTGGTVSSTPASLADLYEGTAITLTATPDLGYYFVEWTDSGGTRLGTAGSLAFTLTGDTSFIAVFDSMEYTVTGVSANAAMGSVTGSGTAKYNRTITLTATPNYGYRFVNWTSALGVAGTDPVLVVTADRNITYTAHFDTVEYSVTLGVTGEGMGDVDGPTTLKHFTSYTYRAVARYGYHFVNWTDAAGTVLATSDALTVAPTSDTTIYANFTYNQYTITAVSADTVMGSAAGTATVNYLQTVSVTATANYGYHFTCWTNAAGDTIGTGATIAVQALRDSVVTAHFDLNLYRVTCLSSNSQRGSVCCSQTAGYLQTITLTAAANTGYWFAGWTNSHGDTLGTQPTLTFQVTRDSSITACFEVNRYTVTISSNDPAKGSVAFSRGSGIVDHGDGTATVDHGTRVTISATATTCNQFTRWSTGGRFRVIGYTATAPASFTAFFDSTEYHSDSAAVVCDSFDWYGRHLDSTCVATRLLATAQGCDSTASLHLTVNHSVAVDTSIAACDSFEWQDSTYTGSAVATHTFATTQGCDSVVTLRLSINHSVATDTTVAACDSFTWHDSTYTESTVVSRIFTSQTGCDSTVTLYLTVNHSVATDTVAVACDSFVWNDSTYAESTHDSRTFTGQTGCDSTVTLYLTVNHSVATDTVAVACDSFMWQDSSYTESTTDSRTLATIQGCDSVLTLRLTLNHSTSSDTAATACDSFTWYDSTYTTSTVNTLTLTTTQGCDSVLTLRLTINNSARSDTVAAACDSFTWMDSTYTESTTDTRSLATTQGCDSVLTLQLTLNHSATTDTIALACNSFTWYGLHFDSSAVATRHLTTIDGCDSTVSLNLTISQSLEVDTMVAACDSFEWMDSTYTESTTDSRMLVAAGGCDSTVVLRLTINHSVATDTAIVVCDSLAWFDSTYTESTIVNHTLVGQTGCDSTVTLHLTVNHSIATDTAIMACDSFVWYDSTYTESTTVSRTFTSQTGCDSTVTLRLAVNHSIATDTAVSACDSFVWQDSTYTASAVDTYLLSTADGCDSVVTLILTINQSAALDTVATACDSFTWMDSTYSVSTVDTRTLATAEGCDSIVTISLTVNHSAANDTVATACDSFTWMDSTYTASTVDTHLLSTAEGCDSTLTLLLTVNHSTASDDNARACNIYIWHGTEYTASTDSALFRTINAAGCDSVVTLHLVIDTCPVTTVVACDSFHWHDSTYTESGTHVYGTDTLLLTINHSRIVDTAAVACDRYEWLGNTYTASDSLSHTFSTVHGCDSIVNVALTVGYTTFDTVDMTVADSLVWNGNVYHDSGTYTDTLASVLGCDSIVTLRLTIHVPAMHRVTLVSIDSAMGTVDPDSSASVEHGTEFTANATPREGRHFVAWMHGRSIVSTDNPYTFQVMSNTSLLALFAYDSVVITISVDDSVMGTVDPAPGTYTLRVGDTLCVHARPQPGYRATTWLWDGTAIHDRNTTPRHCTIPVSPSMSGSSHTLHVLFAPILGIAGAQLQPVTISSKDGRIFISGASDREISIYDASGRLLLHRTATAEQEEYEVPASGLYLIGIDNEPARRISIIR